ncbi:LOW QUALITY PROTEIN: Secreted protein [Phytophthora megakarya]|uniref:Secreted protein n=1 Tax=Phytophthora megakarya TaxID=4795 RepID=A0A225W0Q0_9STRA|nr:LOW QUALITY PROTEIN: Secreted protein [Phytophthora megakarya]
MQLSDDKDVAEVVLNYYLKCSKNVSTVTENSRGQTGVIAFTTAHMRKIVDTFPEVVEMDCTHKTNKNNYQLLSIVAMDLFGRGQHYSFLETTSDWHMPKASAHFKRANEHWKLVRIVIVDKDLREVEVIKRKLPEANVILCHFHVIKWLHDVAQRGSMGRTHKTLSRS